jgi:hypothetical protein
MLLLYTSVNVSEVLTTSFFKVEERSLNMDFLRNIGQLIYSTPKTEAVNLSETLLTVFQVTQPHNVQFTPQDRVGLIFAFSIAESQTSHNRQAKICSMCLVALADQLALSLPSDFVNTFTRYGTCLLILNSRTL